MKTYGGSGVIAPQFLTSALDGGDWSASRLCRFIPGETASPHSLYAMLGGLHSLSGRNGEEKYFLPLQGIKPRLFDRPARSLVDI
jgi:hypothetical protein